MDNSRAHYRLSSRVSNHLGLPIQPCRRSRRHSLKSFIRPAAQFGWVLPALAVFCGSAPGRLEAGIVAWGSSQATNVPAGLSGLVAVSAGASHALALQRDGRVVGWGDNSVGQAVAPTDLTNAVAIAAGKDYSLALRSDGTVTQWGRDDYIPSVPAGLTSVVTIAAGYTFSMALRSDGTVVGWGMYWSGPSSPSNIVAIAAGSNHGLALKANGTVVTWGSYWDAIGNGHSAGSAVVPEGLSGIVAVAAGALHSLGLKRDGTVVCWGDNRFGQCNVPAALSNVVAIAAGAYHSVALMRDGTVVSWGDNTYGQLNYPTGLINVSAISAGNQGFATLALVGEGSPYITAQPVSLQTYSGWPVELQAFATGATPLHYQWRHYGSDVAGATDAVLALAAAQVPDNGGYALVVTNAFGSATTLKANLSVIESAPLLVTTLTDQMAYAGKPILLAASAVGSGPLFYQWRKNGLGIPGATDTALSIASTKAADAGQYSVVISNSFGAITNEASLGFSTMVGWAPASSPLTELYPPAGLTDLVSVAPVCWYGTTNVGLRRDGTLAAWDDSGRPVVLPVQLTNVQALAAGGRHWLALKTDGTVVAWGDNSHSQTNVPAGLSNVVGIATGDFCSLAIRADGTMAAWGTYFIFADGYSQIFPATVPAGITNIVAADAGLGHVLALSADGRMVSWGDTTLSASNVVGVAAFLHSSIAVLSDGTLQAWDQASPPPNSTNVVQATIGMAHSVYTLKDDGTVTGYPFAAPAGLTNACALFAAIYSPGNTFALAGEIAPFFSLQPLSLTQGAGHEATLHSRATGSPSLRYQWRRNGADLAGATGANLVLTNLQAANGGSYTVVASNLFGTLTSAVASLTVTNTAPFLTGQPLSQVVWRGTNVSFTTAANGSEPITYQWRFNGTDLAGATNPQLVLTNVQSANGGTYQVAVSNAVEFALSSNASLTVLIPVSEALNGTGLVWATSGQANWFGEPSITHDGIAAAQSGPVTNNQQSILTTVVGGGGTIGFWWKVSSEQYWDKLGFLVGGTELAAISGEVDWQYRTFPIPAGLQTLQWVYAKDGSGSVGLDTAWLDQVSYTGGNMLWLTQVACTGNSFTTTLLTSNGKTYVLEYKNSLSESGWLPLATNLGVGTLQTLQDTNASAPQRFYRVRQSD